MDCIFMILISFTYSVDSYYTSDYEEVTPRQFIEKLNEQDMNDDEPEPFNPFTSNSPQNTNETLSFPALEIKNLLCEDFEEYARNCTNQAKRIYNSTPACLPLPHELSSWCTALKYLATCEYDWNTDCQDVTEKNFNELTIQGQLHVLDKVCHDEWFSVRYDTHLEKCISAISKEWAACYLSLKFHSDLRKNATKNWLHYESHFYLCCARTRFRRCTLEVLLNFPYNCTTHQSILLQKFSSIISEGEIFQDCNFNMIYPSCPGGDPRPPPALLSKLMGEDGRSFQELRNSAFRAMKTWFFGLIICCSLLIQYITF